jgi:hypothetical protein
LTEPNLVGELAGNIRMPSSSWDPGEMIAASMRTSFAQTDVTPGSTRTPTVHAQHFEPSRVQ